MAPKNVLTLSYDPAGDYSFGGWDRFGRIVDQKWTSGTNATVVDEFTYTYDRNSNRLTRGNGLDSSFSENYTYDALDRLVDADRDGTNLQSWGLDQLGNWNSTTRGSTTETRTHNAANEITAIDGSSSYTDSDAAGNMIVMPKADGSGYLGAIYDAWNRMTAVFDAAGTAAEYQYDGAGRRIVKTLGSDAYSTYYNEDWQALETRKNGDADPLEQTIWDIRYIDSPVVRFFDGNTDGDYADAGDNTLYAINDANFNVTAVVDASSGNPVERYIYSPYGERTVLDEDFANPTTASAFTWNLGHQGLLHDTESGLVYNRNRMLDPGLGRFLQRDPLGYVDGMGLYEYVRSSPSVTVDPYGQQGESPADCAQCICEKEPEKCYFKIQGIGHGTDAFSIKEYNAFRSETILVSPGITNIDQATKTYNYNAGAYIVRLLHKDGKPTSPCSFVQDVKVGSRQAYKKFALEDSNEFYGGTGHDTRSRAFDNEKFGAHYSFIIDSPRTGTTAAVEFHFEATIYLTSRKGQQPTMKWGYYIKWGLADRQKDWEENNNNRRAKSNTWFYKRGPDDPEFPTTDATTQPATTQPATTKPTTPP